MDDVDRIVAGLSQSQKTAIVHPHHGPYATSIYPLTSASCRAALRRKGVVVDRMYATALTPLGLAVRARLAEVQSHE